MLVVEVRAERSTAPAGVGHPDLPPGRRTRSSARSPTRCCTPARGALPAERGDFGGGVVEVLGPRGRVRRPGRVRLRRGRSRACSSRRACPGCAPSQFGPDRLQRVVPGRSAAQHFFTEGGRAFCLFVVLGSHARRMALVPRAARLVGGFGRHRAGRRADEQDGDAVSALDRVTSDAGPSARLVDRLARRLGALSRRGFLARTAVVGSALAVDPRGYVLTPRRGVLDHLRPGQHRRQRLHASSAARSTRASTPARPGTFTAGWWKAADSSWCCGGYRYIIDCNAKCVTCSTGCAGDHICDRTLLELLVRPGLDRPPATSAGTAATRSATASATPTSGAAAGWPAGW